MANEEEKKVVSLKELLSADTAKFREQPEDIIKSDVLSKKLGTDAYVKVRGVKPRVYENIVRPATDNDNKQFDAKLMMLVEGVVEPDLKDKELQTYFGTRTPKELAETLFGADVNTIFERIGQLSGYIDEDGADRNLADEAKN